MGKIIHNGRIYSSSPQDVLDLDTKINNIKGELLDKIYYNTNNGVKNLASINNCVKTIYTGTIPVDGRIATEYVISLKRVLSTDTDDTDCLMMIYYVNGSNTEHYIERNTAIRITIDASTRGGISGINIYAARTYTKSTGDTVTVENLMVTSSEISDNSEFTPYAESNSVLTEKMAVVLSDGAYSHNTIYRGKNLTDIYTPAQIRANIQNNFKDLYLGDYFEMTLSDTKKCRLEVAHFNYYMSRGLTASHVVFIVGHSSDGYAGTEIGTNGTAGTTTGYYNSVIHTTALPAWVTKVETALGYSLTSFKERLSSAINASAASMVRQPNGDNMLGCVSAMTWDTVKALLPNSMQVYGESVCSNTIAETALSNQKFALFNYESFWRQNPITDVTGAATDVSTAIWLRDIFGNGYMMADLLGRPGRRGVDAGAMLRPYVIIS